VHYLLLAPINPFPPRDGVAIRLSEFLRRLDGEITLLVFGDEASEEPLPAPLRGVIRTLPRPPAPKRGPIVQSLFGRPTMLDYFRCDRYRTAVGEAASTRPALVLAVGLQMAQFLDEIPAGVPKVLDDFNVEWSILGRLSETRTGLKRLYWAREAGKLKQSERELIRRADVVIATSEFDRSELQRLAPKSDIRVVGPSIPEPRLDLPARENAAPTFVYTGAFHWHVNVVGAVWLCREVMPRLRSAVPDACVQIVGKDPSPEVRELADLPGVTVTGTVPEVGPYLSAATGAVVPLQYGSGVRYKILEAFAHGAPVVSTPVGCEGLGLRSGKELLVAETPERFASACVRLVKEPPIRAGLIREGAAYLAEVNAATDRSFRNIVSELVGREPAAADR
jgi:polysaccharide biosynthesis protein PslH